MLDRVDEVVNKCIELLNKEENCQDDVKVLLEIGKYYKSNFNKKRQESNLKVSKENIEDICDYFKNAASMDRDDINKKYSNIYNIIKNKLDLIEFILNNNIEKFSVNELKVVYFLIVNKSCKNNKKQDIISNLKNYIEQKKYYKEFLDKF